MMSEPNRFFVGVDPGVSGALALYDRDQRSIEVWDMPTAQVRVGKRTVNRVVPRLLADLVHDEFRGITQHAYIEEVHAMRGQGVTSVYTFGHATGLVQGMLLMADIPVSFHQPAQWKRTAGLPIGATKDQSRTKACELFPKQAQLFARKMDHNRADAALMAYVGAMNHPF